MHWFIDKLLGNQKEKRYNIINTCRGFYTSNFICYGELNKLWNWFCSMNWTLKNDFAWWAELNSQVDFAMVSKTDFLLYSYLSGRIVSIILITRFRFCHLPPLLLKRLKSCDFVPLQGQHQDGPCIQWPHRRELWHLRWRGMLAASWALAMCATRRTVCTLPEA